MIVFDLDDTLYPEIEFVYSGFQAVALFLEPILNRSCTEILNGLKQELAVKRAFVFNRYLEKCGFKNKHLVEQCLSIYRKHDASINLYPEADDCLRRLQAYPLYIVTDGNKRVQKQKFIALGLEERVRKCLCTYAYGTKYTKPSPYCFFKIAAMEKVSPAEIVYIADNPYKDFVGIKPEGFRTIQVLKGPYQKTIIPQPFKADLQVDSLADVNDDLLKRLGLL